MSTEAEILSTEPKKESKKFLAGLMGILLGSLGIHKFVLGYNKEGIIYLVLNIIVIPIAGLLTCGIGFSLYGVTSLIALIEGIIYLSKSDEEFIRIYQDNKKAWF
jgi:TM2 domain-containing membrane protein YozV